MERTLATLSERFERRKTRMVRVGKDTIGDISPIVVQSMTATNTQDVEATVAQVNALHTAGAVVVRVAVDSVKDADALAPIREQTQANLSADLQENYRLAANVAPYVDKIRYNPGHLYHHEKGKSVRDKVGFIAEAAAKYDCAIRIGVNCGSVEPELMGKFGEDAITPMIESAAKHCQILDDLGFTQYVVSLKDSDPKKVIEANTRFAKAVPDVPLHLGVTEAGLPPDGVNKSRFALGTLLSMGIGETLRISLTVPNELKVMEIESGLQLIDDVVHNSPLPQLRNGLNIVSCPSCSRVENEAFVQIAERVREVTEYAASCNLTIAVMGCRVNGPGETDNADLGLWCAPRHVNLKRGTELLGTFSYEEILPRLLEELDQLIAGREISFL